MGFTGDMRQWATLPGRNLLFLLVAAGLGIAWLRDCITHEYVASGTLVPIMRRYPHLRQARMSSDRRVSTPLAKSGSS